MSNPRVKFIGDPSDGFSGPHQMTWQGQQFKKGHYRDVPPALAEKAKTHTHFVVEGDPDPTEQEQEEEEERPAKQWTVAELRALLDERGVNYAKNAGAKALMLVVVENGGVPE